MRFIFQQKGEPGPPTGEAEPSPVGSHPCSVMGEEQQQALLGASMMAFIMVSLQASRITHPPGARQTFACGGNGIWGLWTERGHHSTAASSSFPAVCVHPHPKRCSVANSSSHPCFPDTAQERWSARRTSFPKTGVTSDTSSSSRR